MHDLDELKRAVDAGAEIIGVNSRNLRTLTVHPEVFEKRSRRNCREPLSPSPRAAFAHWTTSHVSQRRGYRAFLVGERLIAQADPARPWTNCEASYEPKGESVRHLPGRGRAAGGRAGCFGDRLHLLAVKSAVLRAGRAQSIAADLSAADHRASGCSSISRSIGHSDRAASFRLAPSSCTDPKSIGEYDRSGETTDHQGRGCPEGFDPPRSTVVPDGVTVLLDAHDPVRRGGTGRTIDWTRGRFDSSRGGP